jgi:aspartyl-tRNA(Asn)/glutamyl-tRNA(Gln) amidotransferase subunit C
VSLKFEDIQKLGELARLRIEPDDVDDLVAKLSSILAFVDQLQAADTSDVPPMAHPLDTTQRLRPDRVTESDEHELHQRNAPRVEAGLYLVPKVIE